MFIQHSKEVEINFSQFNWDYHSEIMTQDVLFAGGAAEKPPQIPEECFCRETTVLCDVPDPCVHVLLLPGVHRPLTHPTSLTLRPPGKHMGHSPTVSHENPTGHREHNRASKENTKASIQDL